MKLRWGPEMRRRTFLEFAAAAALASCSGLPPAGDDAGQPPGAGPFAGGFDVDLYRAVAAGPGSQFLSPFSVACAFALLYPGARGTTAAEFAPVFGFAPSPGVVASEIRELQRTLSEHAGGSEFTTANAAWIERRLSLRADYARMIRDEFGAEIEAVDFATDQAAALRTINAWAARKTQNRIPEILTREDPKRMLVLTNAVYFKGKWSDPFEASETSDGAFFAASRTETARLMRHETYARYFDGGAFQAAEFDYDDGEFALAVFLPRQRNGLGAFERELTGAKLDRWLRRLSGADEAFLDVTLPKVKLNAEYELSKPLQSLGLRAAFSQGADFSGVAEQISLAVSAVVHKTFLAIDEEGTEAAAVTAADVVVTGSYKPKPPIVFKADHPFFIVLRHKTSKARLFLGRIATTA